MEFTSNRKYFVRENHSKSLERIKNFPISSKFLKTFHFESILNWKETNLTQTGVQSINNVCANKVENILENTPAH